jgi:hypothetical protein
MGGAAGAATGGSGGGGDSAAGGSGGDFFPNGGRQYKTIVNIVDPAAVKKIEAVLQDASGAENYASVTQDFYALYPDEYDFLYFILDHEIVSSTSAAFERVNRPVISGIGADALIARNGYGTHGRLKGAAGFQGGTGMPPFAHETLHFWGNDLDPALGFGKDRDHDYGAHWGQVGVYGQLGGFDPTTLRCANPAGATPPGCTPETNGRFRYVASAFGPSSNSAKGVLYAPLELYLMGLVSEGDVPASFPLLQDASLVSDDLKADTALVEAAGIGQIAMSAIVARHGARAPATVAEKQFTAAFVLVSAAPASTTALESVVLWQEIFGKYVPASGDWLSFEEHTGGRATMVTRIGRRLAAGDPPPVPPLPDVCHPFTQNCGTPSLGCYGFEAPQCLPTGGRAKDALCTVETDCAPGSTCTVFDFNSPDMKCEPYCDPNDAAAPKACSKLCPNNYVEDYGADLSIVGAICLP